MTTTELSMGLNTEARPSSRVTKPPGGGHTNLFGDADVKPNPPRPTYNQQNSSNMNACMNTSDPSITASNTGGNAPAADAPKQQTQVAASAAPAPSTNSNGSESANNGGRGRIPPGGFSSGGFW